MRVAAYEWGRGTRPRARSGRPRTAPARADVTEGTLAAPPCHSNMTRRGHSASRRGHWRPLRDPVHPPGGARGRPGGHPGAPSVPDPSPPRGPPFPPHPLSPPYTPPHPPRLRILQGFVRGEGVAGGEIKIAGRVFTRGAASAEPPPRPRSGRTRRRIIRRSRREPAPAPGPAAGGARPRPGPGIRQGRDEGSPLRSEPPLRPGASRSPLERLRGPRRHWGMSGLRRCAPGGCQRV